MENENNLENSMVGELGSAYDRTAFFLQHLQKYNLSSSDMDEFKECYKLVSESYDDVKGDRQNCMSISYVAWKVSQVLGLDNKVPEFKFVAPENQLKHDTFWNQICDKRGWNDHKVDTVPVTNATNDDELPDNLNVEYESESNKHDNTPHDNIQNEHELTNMPYKPNEKYTKIDALDEDTPIQGQQFICISFLSPEGVMNTKARAVKFRGAFPTYEKAKAHAAKLQKEDPYFDIFVGEGGKWLLWDPDPHSVENVKFGNKDMQKLEDTRNKRQQQKLNELVARKKEIADKKTASHSRTVAEKIRTGVNEEGGGTMDHKRPEKSDNTVPVQPTKSTGKMSRLEAIRARMKKTLSQKNKSKNTVNSEQHSADTEKLKEQLTEEKEVQLNNITQRLDDLKTKQSAAQKIEENLEKIEKYMKNKGK